MSDKLTGPLSLETYLNKQESLLVESIRRHLQAETKVSLLESAVQELHRKNEELNGQLEINRTTIEQSINGLQAVTLERDKFSTRISELEKSLTNSENEKTEFRSKCNESNNRAAVLEQEIRQLNNKLQVASNDYAGLKENYNRVLAALDETNKKLEEVSVQNSVEASAQVKSKSRAKKTQGTGSEWLDGEYKIST